MSKWADVDQYLRAALADMDDARALLNPLAPKALEPMVHRMVNKLVHDMRNAMQIVQLLKSSEDNPKMRALLEQAAEGL
jgi:hypothetical protein